MTDRETNIFDMFISTVQFDLVNAADYAHLPEAEANFAIVRAVIAKLEEYSAAQVSGAVGQAVEQKSVLRAAIRRKMKRYSRTARALNIDDPGLRRLFRVPDSDNDQLLLSSAREFVAEARRFETAFAGCGISKTVNDALEADITAMETAISAKAGARIEKVGATAGVDDEIERGMNAEKILDSMMHNVYDDNPVKLAEWMTARHIKRLKKSSSDNNPAENPPNP